MATCFGAVHVPQASVRWRDDGQERPKHVALKIKKLMTKYTIVVFDGNYKQFVYLVKMCRRNIWTKVYVLSMKFGKLKIREIHDLCASCIRLVK